MKNWFFHQEKGKTLGPITADEIKSRVREGRIRMFDLVYREGEAGWRMALEHPDLRREFKTTTVKTLQDRPWVCLQRKSGDSFDFGTSGPFSSEDIRLQLQEGLISYSDYVWRDGFSEWRRIGSLEDFNRRLQAARERKDRRGTEADQAPPLPEVPGRELLKSVVEMKRPEAPSVAPPPVPKEAQTPDLTKAVVPPVAEKRKESKPVAIERRKGAGVPMTEPPDPVKAQRRRKAASLTDWVVVVVLAAVLCAVVLTVSEYLHVPTLETDVAQTPAAPPRPPAEPEPAPEPPAEPLEAPPEIPPDIAVKESKPAPPQNIAATELILNVASGGPNQVKIELRTDAAGEDNPVYLQVIGLPGQVSDGAAYYKFLRLVNKTDRKEPFDLSGINLPQGKFVIRAEAGNLKKEAKVSVGVAEAAYKTTVARLRKTYAQALWRERLELVKLGARLEKQMVDAGAGKKFSAKGLEALEGVKRSNGANYLLYDQWSELKEILAQARGGTNPALLTRVKQSRERLATFSVWK